MTTGEPVVKPPVSGASPPAPAVDVLVPIYGAAAELARCLASLRRHGGPGEHRLLLLLDGPQPREVEASVAGLRSDPGPWRVTVLRAPRRTGYVAMVNRGLGQSSGDVVLLNSDTEVTAGWLSKLARAATSAPRVASVTPFSNHATLCSLPRFLAENHLPASYDADGFGRLVEGCSQHARPCLPTGVGFCLYLTRAALDAVGPFDDERFGLGYGEEVDWCLRARRDGWRHLLDDSTFVYHVGQSSFGASRSVRVRAAHRVLRRRHPGYLAEIADFIRRDPLAPLRERVMERLRPPPSPPRPPGRVVHLVHGWPPYDVGGTEVYARALATRQARWRRASVFARLAHPARHRGDAVERMDRGVRVRLTVNNFVQRNPLSRNAIYDRSLALELRRFLGEEAPDLIHVHHLAGHAANLARVAAERQVPIVFQLQDWWAPCARVNLLHRDGTLCDGPGIGRCSACRPLTALPGSRLWNPLLHVLRRSAMRRALATADLLVAGSEHIVETYRRLGFLPAGVTVRVVHYGIEDGRSSRLPPPPSFDGRPLRFGYVGAVLPHKGVAVAVEAFRGISSQRATLEVWGNPDGDRDFVSALRRRAEPGTVSFRGAFSERDKSRVLAGLDVLLVPSLGYESFGLVAREAMAGGVPVLVSDRGALAEMMPAHPRHPSPGAKVPAGDVQAWHAWIERLVADPGRIIEWRRNLLPVKGMDEHAEEIETLYGEVLARGRR